MDWGNLAKAYKNQTCTDKISITRYLHTRLYVFGKEDEESYEINQRFL